MNLSCFSGNKILRRGISCLAVIGLSVNVGASALPQQFLAVSDGQSADSAVEIQDISGLAEELGALRTPVVKEPWLHPALKPLERAIPDSELIIPNREGWVNALDDEVMYSPMNSFIRKEDKGSGPFKNTGDIYKLLPAADSGFEAEPAVKPGLRVTQDIYASAMGKLLDGRKVIYYLQRQASNFIVRMAIDGERQTHQLPAVRARSAKCAQGSAAVAPNGSLWFSTDQVGNGKNNLSILKSNGTVTSSQRFEPAPGTKRLEAASCLYGGTFGEDGNYYARVGSRGSNADDDVIQFDLSDFPNAVRYSRVQFPAAQRGQGLTWHDGKWWSASRRDGLNPVSLHSMDPYSKAVDAHQTKDINILYDVVSAELIPEQFVGVEHNILGSPIIAAGDTVTYQVSVKNNLSAGASYDGPLLLDASSILGEYEELSLEVFDRLREAQDSGDTASWAADAAKKSWSGSIPSGGELVWTYRIRTDGALEDNSVLIARAFPWGKVLSNCQDGDVERVKCNAGVTVKNPPENFLHRNRAV